MLAEFQDDTSAELASATADRDSVQAEYMARSAVNLARLLIASEPTIRAAIAPLFMLMKSKPPQLPVWEFSDRLLGGVQRLRTPSKDFGSSLGLDMTLGKNLGLPGGRFELVIVDEDSKIDANLGAAERHRAHPPREGAHGSDRRRSRTTRCSSRGTRTGTSTTACRPARRSSTGPTSTTSSSPATRRRTPRRAAESRTSSYSAPAEAVPPQERPVRLARGAPHGQRRDRRLLDHVRRPRPDEPEEAGHDRLGPGPDQREHGERRRRCSP